MHPFTSLMNRLTAATPNLTNDSSLRDFEMRVDLPLKSRPTFLGLPTAIKRKIYRYLLIDTRHKFSLIVPPGVKCPLAPPNSIPASGRLFFSVKCDDAPDINLPLVNKQMHREYKKIAELHFNATISFFTILSSPDAYPGYAGLSCPIYTYPRPRIMDLTCRRQLILTRDFHQPFEEYVGMFRVTPAVRIEVRDAPDVMVGAEENSGKVFPFEYVMDQLLLPRAGLKHLFNLTVYISGWDYAAFGIRGKGEGDRAFPKGFHKWFPAHQFFRRHVEYFEKQARFLNSRENPCDDTGFRYISELVWSDNVKRRVSEAIEDMIFKRYTEANRSDYQSLIKAGRKRRCSLRFE